MRLLLLLLLLLLHLHLQQLLLRYWRLRRLLQHRQQIAIILYLFEYSSNSKQQISSDAVKFLLQLLGRHRECREFAGSSSSGSSSSCCCCR